MFKKIMCTTNFKNSQTVLANIIQYVLKIRQGRFLGHPVCYLIIYILPNRATAKLYCQREKENRSY